MWVCVFTGRYCFIGLYLNIFNNFYFYSVVVSSTSSNYRVFKYRNDVYFSVFFPHILVRLFDVIVIYTCILFSGSIQTQTVDMVSVGKKTQLMKSEEASISSFYLNEGYPENNYTLSLTVECQDSLGLASPPIPLTVQVNTAIYIIPSPIDCTGKHGHIYNPQCHWLYR